MALNTTEYPQLADQPVGKQIHSIYQSRLRQFTDGGQYYNQGLSRSVSRIILPFLQLPSP